MKQKGENCNAVERLNARVRRGAQQSESCNARGVYNAVCRDASGKLKWQDTFSNLVTTEGKNFALNTFLAGSAYTVTGPYLGLISSVDYTAIDAADTAAQINGSNGWKEAGSGSNYPLHAARELAEFLEADAGATALSSTVVTYTIITTGGTVKGAFMVIGDGASDTIASTTGVLFSVGLFSSGDKVMDISDTLEISYALSL